MATSYLQQLPSKPNRPNRNILNKTTTSGFNPTSTSFGGFAGVGKMVTSKNGSRDNSGDPFNSGGPRETWNMVYTEPSIVAESHKARDQVT